MYNRILIGTDGSELAGKAVDHGIELARSVGAEVVFVSVTQMWSPLEMASQYEEGDLEAVSVYEDAMTRVAEKLLADCAARAEAKSVRATTRHIADMRPAEGILHIAELENCDLIVMATHGRRGLEKVLIGSQTAEVLATSQRPVLVLH